jgi:hypothetical protein
VQKALTLLSPDQKATQEQRVLRVQKAMQVQQDLRALGVTPDLLDLKATQEQRARKALTVLA